MAASEMYDFLNSASPDFTGSALSISPQEVLVEEGEPAVSVHEAEDGSEERIVLSTLPTFYVTFPWNGLSESDAGTIFDYYFNSSKAGGRARSFKWTHVDGHQYVVRFDCVLSRTMLKAGGPFRYSQIKLKVLGRV